MDQSEDYISFVSVPSLQSAAMMKIVSKLWELECSRETIDFTLMISDYYNKDAVHSKEYRAMEKNLLDRLSSLPLPNQLRREIIRFVMPIGQQLLGWLNPKNFSLCLLTLNQVCWTSEGTIDSSETIRLNFDHHREDKAMFIVVSQECLEDLVIDAFKRMPESVTDVDSRENNQMCLNYSYYYHLVIYWICFCKGDFSRFMEVIKKTDPLHVYNEDESVYMNMFELAEYTGNCRAAKYFWPKLTKEEKNLGLNLWVDNLMINSEPHEHTFHKKNEEHSDLLCFLLGQMNVCEQRKVFKTYGAKLLESLFYNWPWTKYVLPTISVMFPILDQAEYVNFMSQLVSRIKKGRMTEKIFREVWFASPQSFRMRFVEDLMEFQKVTLDAFDNLFSIGDFDTIKLILNCAPREKMRKFIFSYGFLEMNSN